MMIKLGGPIHNPTAVPLKCRRCGKPLKKSGRKEPFELCNGCRKSK